MNNDSTQNNNSDQNATPIPTKKTWDTPTCSDLEDLSIEGGGGLSTEGGTGVVS